MVIFFSFFFVKKIGFDISCDKEDNSKEMPDPLSEENKKSFQKVVH